MLITCNSFNWLWDLHVSEMFHQLLAEVISSHGHSCEGPQLYGNIVAWAGFVCMYIHMYTYIQSYLYIFRIIYIYIYIGICMGHTYIYIYTDIFGVQYTTFNRCCCHWVYPHSGWCFHWVPRSEEKRRRKNIKKEKVSEKRRSRCEHR